MSCERKKDVMTEEIVFDDGQRVIVDSVGVSHFFLPRGKCKNSDD